MTGRPAGSPAARRLVLPGGLLIAACLATAPLLTHVNLPRGDDVGEHVQFVQDFSAALAEGHLYPRWLPHANLGYGAPAFIFYPPLATAVVSWLHRAGFDLFAAFRVGLFLLTLAAAAAAAGLGRQVVPDSPLLGPLVAGTLWVALPYHAVDLFSRFALAETATFVFLPLLFLALEQPGRARVAGGAAAYAGLCLSHPPTAFLAGVFVLGWGGLVRGRPWRRAVAALVLGAGCAAVYLLPAVLERPQVHADWLESNPHYRFDAHYLLFPARTEILDDPVHGAYAGFLQTRTLRQIRLLVPLTLALALGSWLVRRFLHRGGAARDPLNRYLALCLVAAAGMTRLADPVWRWVPGFASVVFPWRLALFLTLGAAVLAAAALGDLLRLRPRSGAVAVALIGALAFAGTLTIASGADWTTFTPAHARTPVVRLRVAGAMMPRGNPVMRGFSRQPPAAGAALWQAHGPAPDTVEVLREATHRRVYRAAVPAGGPYRLLIPQFAYPGWRARIDGHDAPVLSQPPLGTLAVPLTAGIHQVEVRFAATPLRRLAAAASGLSLLLLAALTLYLRRRTMTDRRPA